MKKYHNPLHKSNSTKLMYGIQWFALSNSQVSNTLIQFLWIIEIVNLDKSIYKTPKNYFSLKLELY